MNHHKSKKELVNHLSRLYESCLMKTVMGFNSHKFENGLADIYEAYLDKELPEEQVSSIIDEFLLRVGAIYQRKSS